MKTHCENCNSELTKGDHFRHEQDCKKYKVSLDEICQLCKCCEGERDRCHAMAEEFDEDQPHYEG